MADIVTCPKCSRNLQLLAELVGREVRCPCCSEVFAADPAAIAIPTVQPAAPTVERHRDDDAGLDRASPRRPRPRPKRKSRIVALIAVGVVGLLLCFLVGLLILADRLASWQAGTGMVRSRFAPPPMDPRMAFTQGEQFRNAGNMAEAAAAYRRALDFNPGHSEAFLGLIRVLRPNDQRGDLAHRFTLLGDHLGHFDTFARDCKDRQDTATLELLCKMMRDLGHASPTVDYYEALTKALAGQPDEAVALFNAALKQEDDPRLRHEFLTGFMQAMAASGNAAKAYDMAPDARAAFRVLASQLKTHRARRRPSSTRGGPC